MYRTKALYKEILYVNMNTISHGTNKLQPISKRVQGKKDYTKGIIITQCFSLPVTLKICYNYYFLF